MARRENAASADLQRPLLRAVVALCATVLALFVGGLYNGPLDELPLLLWCAVALVAALWLVPPSAASLRSRVAIIVLVAVIWLLVAWRSSISPSLSLAPTWSLLLLPLSVLIGASTERPLQLVVAASAGALLLAALGLRDLAAGMSMTPVALLDPNNMVTLANLGWMPLLGLALTQRGPRARWLQLALAPMFALIFYQTAAAGSRAGAVIGVLALLVFLVVAARHRQWPAILAIAVGIAFAAPFSMDNGSAAAGGAADFDGAGTRRGLDVRIDQARASIGLWARAPITGTGPQTFHLLYPGVRPESEQTTAGFFVHNDWVQLPQEVGLPGLVGLIAVAFWLIRVGLRYLGACLRPPTAEQQHAALQLGLVLATGGALIHAFVNFTLYVAPLGIMIGLWIGVLARAGAVRPAETARLSFWQRRGSPMIATLMLLPLFLDALSATSLMGHRGMPAQAQLLQPDNQAAVARSLLWLAPDDSVPAFFIADGHLRAFMNEQDPDVRIRQATLAVVYFEMAVARDPLNGEVLHRYADLIQALGGEVVAPGAGARTDVELLQQAHRLDPASTRTVHALGSRLVARGDIDAERALLESWLRYCRFASRGDPEGAQVILRRAEALAVAPERVRACPARGTEG